MSTAVLTPSSSSTCRGLVPGLIARLEAPVDPAGLAAFRILFGVVVAAGAARFLASGFLDKLYGCDARYFRYPGLAWVPVPSPDVIGALYLAFIALGVLIAAGLFFRVACAAFTILFTWVQLVDVTNYLNHYYLVVLLAFLLTLSPANARFSVDARWFGAGRRSIPFFFTALLRFQVGCVYVCAAIAKLGADWLVYGQPMGLWLPARDELPLLGPLLALPFVPLVFSLCGFLYDASIVWLLLWRRTRPLAYVAVLVFHGLTFALFEIGMFPFIMVTTTTIFFHPSWPRRWVAKGADDVDAAPQRIARPVLALAMLWVAFHVAFPLRCQVIGDDVLWDEAGMRWSWRVMVREKSGSLTYRVTRPGGRVVVVGPHDLLTPRQANEMIGQPDLILQLAHHIRDDFAAGGVVVEVRADALVSLNARRTHRFVDPTVDLALVEDTAGRPAWILPAPTEPPRASWQR
ncbi:MAG: HTTM domain-containing protein [Deltaproteobacteria bacterium]|nr:HTTM domain-containing protein [Deltaproteobacteria bacterium]